MAIVTVEIDLAKNVCAVHGVDEFGKTALACPTLHWDGPRSVNRLPW